VFLSVAVDLVIQEIQEPVRFLIETKARIFPPSEKFWYFGKKILRENFFVRLREVRFVTFAIPSFLLQSVCLCEKPYLRCKGAVTSWFSR